MDTACLIVNNNEDTNLQKLQNSIIEVWAQSSECYQCLPWKFLTVKAGSNSSMSVNATYITQLFMKNFGSSAFFYRTSFHFKQSGIYSVDINATSVSKISILKEGNNEYLSILYVFIFFMVLFIGWPCSKRIFQNRRLSMQLVGNQLIESSTDDTEQLVENQNEEEFSQPLPDYNTPNIKQRLNSLDTFRGLSIILMIFVNYGGGEFYFFRHAKWNGLTVADLVFPWFLWIMGLSLVFSLRSQLEKRTSYKLILYRIFRRSTILFLLGIIINSIKSNYLPSLRILGVLQRFSLCYLINSLLELLQFNVVVSRFGIFIDIINSLIQWTVILLLVIINLAITFALPFPGCPIGYLGPGGLHMNGSYSNCTGGAAAFVDQMIFGQNHIYENPSCKVIYNNPGPFDPEGLLGTLMACLTVQLGVSAGRIIFYFPHHSSRILRWTIWGTILGLLSGCLCGFQKEVGPIPINKNLWSLSYSLATASFAFFLFAFLYFVIDVRCYSRGSFLRVTGMNAIILYMGHEFTHKVFPFSWSPGGDSHTERLLMNLNGTFLWILIAYWCHSKKFYFSL